MPSALYPCGGGKEGWGVLTTTKLQVCYSSRLPSYPPLKKAAPTSHVLWPFPPHLSLSHSYVIFAANYPHTTLFLKIYRRNTFFPNIYMHTTFSPIHHLFFAHIPPFLHTTLCDIPPFFAYHPLSHITLFDTYSILTAPLSPSSTMSTFLPSSLFSSMSISLSPSPFFSTVSTSLSPLSLPSSISTFLSPSPLFLLCLPLYRLCLSSTMSTSPALCGNCVAVVWTVSGN